MGNSKSAAVRHFCVSHCDSRNLFVNIQCFTFVSVCHGSWRLCDAAVELWFLIMKQRKPELLGKDTLSVICVLLLFAQ